MKKTLQFYLISFLILSTHNTFSQELKVLEKVKVNHDVCIYKPDPNPIKGYVPRALNVAARMASKSLMPCATIDVTYNGFTTEAQTAFQYAVDIWANSIDSPVDIRIDATFQALDPGVLGSAGPYGVVGLSGGSLPEPTWFPYALADALLGSDQDTSNPDIVASFSSSANFYFGLDGNPGPGQFDFVSVVLHEIGHGLGFLSAFADTDDDDPDNPPPPTTGQIRDVTNNLPSIWDQFIENGSGTSILTFTDPSADLLNQFESDDLFCNGPLAVVENGNIEPKIYAPNTWNPGSSFSHWDETTFPPLNANSLMTPLIGNGEAIHHPGNITLRFMEDMFWTLCPGALLSTQNSISENVFSYYPNPTSSIITLKSKENLQKIEVYNILGKILLSVESNNLQESLNLSYLKSGAYFLKVSTDNTTKTVKIIKN